MKLSVVCIAQKANCGADESFFYGIGADIALFVYADNNLNIIKNTLKFAFSISDGICVVYSKESWANLQKAMLMEFERSSVFVEGTSPYVIAKGFKAVADRVYFDRVYDKPFLMLPYDFRENVDTEPIKRVFGFDMLRVGIFAEKVENKYVVYSDEAETILSVDASHLRDVTNNIDKKKIYTINGETPQMALYKTLQERNVTVSTAESCTAGLISARIADIPGASSYLKGGCAVYSNELKNRFLGVNTNTLKNFGAVSKEVAIQMAVGVLNNAKTDFSASVTGIAGPAGATKEKPVGLVYTAAASLNNVAVEKRIFKGNRKMIRHKSAKFALLFLRDFILSQ